MELDLTDRPPDAPSDVTEGKTPVVVELTAFGTEVVCKVSASVAVRPKLIPALLPEGSTDRLKVIPASAEVILVLLRLPDGPGTAADEDCIGDGEVELAPWPNLIDAERVSLAGMRMSDVSEDGFELEVGITV